MAAIAQVAFVASFLIAGAWQGPRYNALTQSISDMYAVTAPNGLFLMIVLTICGLATVLFAGLSVWPALRRARWPAAGGSVLLGLSIYGLGDLLTPFERVGCRLADSGCTQNIQAASPGGALDSALSFGGIILFVIAPFVIAEAFRRLPEWKAWAWPARVAGLACMAWLVIDIVASARFGGLVERLLAASGAAAIGAFAWRISTMPESERAAVDSGRSASS